MKKQELKQKIIDQQIFIDELTEENDFIKSQLEYACYKYLKDTNCEQLDWKEFYDDIYDDLDDDECDEDDEELEDCDEDEDDDEEDEGYTNGISKSTIKELSSYSDDHLDAIIMFIKAIKN